MKIENHTELVSGYTNPETVEYYDYKHQVMTMKTTTLTPEQLSKYGLDNINCEFYRNITQQGIDSLFEKTNFLDGEEDDNGVITMYCCRVTHVFVPIKRGKYEWWKCY
jgi:hypothetical protein